MDWVTAFCLLGACFGCVRICRIDASFAPFLTVALSICFLYLSAVLGELPMGAMLWLLFGLLSWLYVAHDARQGVGHIAERYFTPGIVAGLFFMIILGALASTQIFMSPDELMHWGPHSKAMFVHRGFETAGDYIFQKSYPPGGRLFHYLFYQLGGFSEGRALLAQVVLVVSPLIVFTRNVTWRHFRESFLWLSLALIVLSMFSYYFGCLISILMEYPVSVFLGMTLVAYFFSPRHQKSLVLLAPVLFALMMLKLKMLPLVLLVIFIISCDQFIAFRCKKACSSALGACIMPLFLVVIALFAHWVWSVQLAIAHTMPDWQLHITAKRVLNVLVGALSSYELRVATHFMGLAAARIGTIFALVCWAGFLGCYLPSRRERLSFWSANVILMLAIFPYFFGLLLMYLYVFNEHQALIAASFERYANIYFAMWSLFLLGGVARVWNQNDFRFKAALSRWLPSVSMGVVFAIIGLYLFLGMQRVIHHRSYTQLRQSLAHISDKVKQIVPPNQSVFTVWQNSRGYQAVTLFYNLMPRRFNDKPVAFGPRYEPQGYWTRDITAAEFKKEVSGFDYLLLGYTDARFWARYGSLLPANPAPLLEYQMCMGNEFNDTLAMGCSMRVNKAYLFRVQKEGGTLRFIDMGTQ